MATTYHNAGLNISQACTSSMNYSASGDFLTAGSGETYILKSIQISNTVSSVGGVFYNTNVNVDLLDYSTGATHSIANVMSVPANSSIDVISDNLVLESQDKITIQITGSAEAETTYRVDAIGSYLKIT